jgi:hypothetical protein
MDKSTETNTLQSRWLKVHQSSLTDREKILGGGGGGEKESSIKLVLLSSKSFSDSEVKACACRKIFIYQKCKSVILKELVVSE